MAIYTVKTIVARGNKSETLVYTFSNRGAAWDYYIKAPHIDNVVNVGYPDYGTHTFSKGDDALKALESFIG